MYDIKLTIWFSVVYFFSGVADIAKDMMNVSLFLLKYPMGIRNLKQIEERDSLQSLSFGPMSDINTNVCNISFFRMLVGMFYYLDLVVIL